MCPDPTLGDSAGHPKLQEEAEAKENDCSFFFACHKQKSKVKECLEGPSTQLQLYTNRDLLPMVVSGLRCWHTFAVHMLDYEEPANLQPRKRIDVVRYTAIFPNSGTAANNIGHIKLVCFSVEFISGHLVRHTAEAWVERANQSHHRSLRSPSAVHISAYQRDRLGAGCADK